MKAINKTRKLSLLVIAGLMGVALFNPVTTHAAEEVLSMTHNINNIRMPVQNEVNNPGEEYLQVPIYDHKTQTFKQKTEVRVDLSNAQILEAGSLTLDFTTRLPIEAANVSNFYDGNVSVYLDDIRVDDEAEDNETYEGSFNVLTSELGVKLMVSREVDVTNFFQLKLVIDTEISKDLLDLESYKLDAEKLYNYNADISMIDKDNELIEEKLFGVKDGVNTTKDFQYDLPETKLQDFSHTTKLKNGGQKSAMLDDLIANKDGTGPYNPDGNHGWSYFELSFGVIEQWEEEYNLDETFVKVKAAEEFVLVVDVGEGEEQVYELTDVLNSSNKNGIVSGYIYHADDWDADLYNYLDFYTTQIEDNDGVPSKVQVLVNGKDITTRNKTTRDHYVTLITDYVVIGEPEYGLLDVNERETLTAVVSLEDQDSDELSTRIDLVLESGAASTTVKKVTDSALRIKVDTNIYESETNVFVDDVESSFVDVSAIDYYKPITINITSSVKDFKDIPYTHDINLNNQN